MERELLERERKERGGGVRKRRRKGVACSCSCLRTHSSVEFCVTPASLRSLVGVCEESEWSEVNVCADALRVASEESTEGEPAASRTCCDRVRVCRGDTCRRDTLNQRPAVCSGTKGKSRLPYSFLFILGIVCVSCGGLVH